MPRFLGTFAFTASLVIFAPANNFATGQQKTPSAPKAKLPAKGKIEQLSGVTHVPYVCAIICPKADLAPVGYEEQIKPSDTKGGAAAMTVRIKSGDVRLKIIPDEPKGVALKSVEISADNKTWKTLRCQDEKTWLYGPNVLADGGSVPVGKDGAFVRANLTLPATKK